MLIFGRNPHNTVKQLSFKKKKKKKKKIGLKEAKEVATQQSTAYPCSRHLAFLGN